ncbi:hypothetical protein CGSMWGv1500E_03454 [Gardnerella vaginalis 1500E]|uniref:Uncharacterized protein n=1 Tax=Gardnerella vaginalis 1500E TaxID=698957 RepID=I4M081_GARVA|nr:hypothetical protein CGSMWGv1500E_03454 [Gardnerella vaginalis 1500E]
MLQCAVQFSAIDSEPVLVAIKCEFAVVGYFVGLGICSDCLIFGYFAPLLSSSLKFRIDSSKDNVRLLLKSASL